MPGGREPNIGMLGRAHSLDVLLELFGLPQGKRMGR